MKAHRFFTILPGEGYSEARACMKRLALTSPHADVPALYAALENPGIREVEDPGGPAIDDRGREQAIARSESLNPANTELLIVKLRSLLKVVPKTPEQSARRNAAIKALVALGQQRLTYEPHVLNHSGIYYTGHSDDMAKGMEFYRRAKEIAPDNPNIVWPGIYVSLVEGDWSGLSESQNFFRHGKDWHWLLINLKLARENGLPEEEQLRLRRALEATGVSTPEEVRRRISDLHYGPPVKAAIVRLGDELL